MVADLQPMSVDNIQLNLKQKINVKGEHIRGCSLLSDGRMVISEFDTDTVRFINKDGIDLFQVSDIYDTYDTYDTVYIKDNNRVAVSSGGGGKRCITMIDIEIQEVMTLLPWIRSFMAWLLEVEHYITLHVDMD